jgi:hypothetical protein
MPISDAHARIFAPMQVPAMMVRHGKAVERSVKITMPPLTYCHQAQHFFADRNQNSGIFSPRKCDRGASRQKGFHPAAAFDAAAATLMASLP